MSNDITPIIMPKWGLEMREGTIVDWLVGEGQAISPGQPILDVETDKLANTYEAPDGGLLRRIVARAGGTFPVKALLGVMAPPSVDDAAIDAYIAGYEAPADAAGGQAEAAAFEHAEIDGIRVRYARRGDFSGGATPLLFVHGFGGDLGNWQFNVDAAAEHAPVLLLDLPGHGGSDIRLPGAGLPALAGFVAAFADAVGVAQAHWVGHSMGAAIAAQLARDHPARVRSLTLISPAGLGEEINTDYTQGFVEAQSRKELKPVLQMLFADPELVSRRLVDDMLRYKRLDGVEALLRELGDSLFADHRQLAQPLRELPAGLPVLLVWGEQDRIIPASQARTAPPGMRVELLPQVGHMAMLERPLEVNQLIREHVRAA